MELCCIKFNLIASIDCADLLEKMEKTRRKLKTLAKVKETSKVDKVNS